MEIKAILNKPCSLDERVNFIIQNNYELGYDIKEDDDKIEAWGFTKEEEEEKEKEIISHLKCTKRVLALMLQQMGVSYTALKELIASNEQAQLEWDLCVELERCNPLLNIMGQQLGLSPEQIDQMFKYVNGWVDTLEVE